MSNEILKCPNCGVKWECDIAEVELDEYEFATGYKECYECSLPEKVVIANQWYEEHKSELSKALWVLTNMNTHHKLTKELLDKHGKALDALDELYHQLADEHRLLNKVHAHTFYGINSIDE